MKYLFILILAAGLITKANATDVYHFKYGHYVFCSGVQLKLELKHIVEHGGFNIKIVSLIGTSIMCSEYEFVVTWDEDKTMDTTG